MKKSRKSQALNYAYVMAALTLIIINANTISNDSWRKTGGSAAMPTIGILIGGMMLGMAISDYKINRKR